MAEKVDTYPRDGQAVWTLYDTDPGSTVPHTQLITGFADGCARQVTASLVMFGAAGLHEVHRYSDAMSEEPWSKADKTYETLKARVCGVKKRTSCPLINCRNWSNVWHSPLFTKSSAARARGWNC